MVGRVPAFARTSFVGLDFRPGKLDLCLVLGFQVSFFLGSYGNPAGCNAWGGGGIITVCLGVGLVC